VGDDTVVELPPVSEGLPDMPPPHLDPYLDAAARCFARFGVSRTSVQDVARELGYTRGTVYRQVGTVQNQLRLLAARDGYRILARIPGLIADLSGPDQIVELVVAAVEESWAHPVLAKVLTDEPEIWTGLASKHLPELRDRVVALIGPFLAAAMDEGRLARRDPTIVASALLRIALTLVVLKPETDVRFYVAELLGPILTP
jgi:AcrR family transcriptional regulator